MEDLEQFLNFALENLSDPRVEFYKKMKYGYRHYFINIKLRVPDDTFNIRETKTLQIIVDCRNNCIEVGQWEDLSVYEDYELTKKWSDRLELVYQDKLSSELQNKILKFFDNVDTQDKDFGRRWKMKDWFNDEKEKPTIQ